MPKLPKSPAKPRKPDTWYLATLHASNALSAFVRLQQLGVDYYQLAACLLMLSCQQLETHGERRQARFQLLPRQTQLINTLLAHQQDDFWPNLAALCRNKEVEYATQSCT